MNPSRIVYTVHAVQRMLEREISSLDVEETLRTGEVLLRRAQGYPYPSRLILGWAGSRPLHVVVAEDQENNRLVVVTAYEPDPWVWERDFRRRRLQ